MTRVNPNVPIETSIKALTELVAEAKIGSIRLSEVSAGTIRRRASMVHTIVLVEIKLSLFTPIPLHSCMLKYVRNVSSMINSTFYPFAKNKK